MSLLVFFTYSPKGCLTFELFRKIYFSKCGSLNTFCQLFLFSWNFDIYYREIFTTGFLPKSQTYEVIQKTYFFLLKYAERCVSNGKSVKLLKNNNWFRGKPCFWDFMSLEFWRKKKKHDVFLWNNYNHKAH